MPDELERLHNKLDDHTVKLTDLGTKMQMYMANQTVLNESLAASLKEHSKELGQIRIKEAGSGHKCAEEILKHEESAWSHNPKKALGLAGGLIGLVEFVRSFFFHK